MEFFLFPARPAQNAFSTSTMIYFPRTVVDLQLEAISKAFCLKLSELGFRLSISKPKHPHTKTHKQLALQHFKNMQVDVAGLMLANSEDLLTRSGTSSREISLNPFKAKKLAADSVKR